MCHVFNRHPRRVCNTKKASEFLKLVCCAIIPIFKHQGMRVREQVSDITVKRRDEEKNVFLLYKEETSKQMRSCSHAQEWLMGVNSIDRRSGILACEQKSRSLHPTEEVARWTIVRATKTTSKKILRTNIIAKGERTLVWFLPVVFSAPWMDAFNFIVW